MHFAATAATLWTLIATVLLCIHSISAANSDNELRPITNYLLPSDERVILQKLICKGWKCPDFTVVKDETPFVQERYYDSFATVATTASGCGNFSDYLLNGYMALFRYRRGNNDVNETIEMTVPVMVEVRNETHRNSLGSLVETCKADYTIRFFLTQDNKTDRFPKPTENNIDFEIVPSADVYVRTYGGYIDDIAWKWTQMKQDLRALNLCFVDETYTVAMYDPPWKKHGRRNELWIQTKDCD